MAVDPFFGSVLSAAGSVVGGLLGNESQRKANENAKDAAAHALRAQDEFAKRGVTYKVRDLMNASSESGIHPLALLGVQGPTYSPVIPTFSGGNPLGEGIARAGQDISRGIEATANRELRAAANDLQMQRFALENDLLRAKIASEVAVTRQVQSAPPMPGPGQRYLLDGQGPTGMVKDKPLERIGPEKGFEYSEPGAVAGVRWERTPTGWAPIKSKDAQEGLEDDMFGNVWWNMRYRFGPSWRTLTRQKHSGVPPVPLKEGMRWHFDIGSGEYRMVPVRSYTVFEGPIDRR